MLRRLLCIGQQQSQNNAVTASVITTDLQSTQRHNKRDNKHY